MPTESFFSSASLAYLASAGAGKDGKTYSIKPTDGSGDFTFSRGSNLAATRVGPTGLIEKGRENLLKQSNNFDTTWITPVSITKTSGQSGYDGSNDAWKIESNGVAAYDAVYQYISISGVNTYSVYAKAGTNNIFVLRSAGAVDARAYFNLSAVSVSVNSSVIDASIESVGNDWYRCSMTFNGANSVVYVYPNELGIASAGYIYIQDAQLEIGLAATEVITTGATTGKAGLLEDEPRFDYSGGATCPSLLLEPSRTNLIPYSEYIEEADIIDAAQVLTTTDATPEGTNNARVLAYNGGTNQHYMSFVPSVTNGETYTFSVFLKKKELRYVALIFLNDYAGRFFDLETGTILGTTGGTLVDSKIENFGNGWYRCSITDVATSTSKFSGVYLSDNGTALGPFVPTGNDGVYIYGYQVEQGSYPTSYIPNHSGTGSVTRGHEMETAISSRFSTQSFSFFADYVVSQASNKSFPVISLDISGTTNDISIYLNGYVGANLYLGSTNGGYIFGSSTNDGVNVGSQSKICVTYDGDEISYYINGALYGSTTGVTFDNADVAVKFSSNRHIFELKKYIDFPEALSQADAITLTTL